MLRPLAFSLLSAALALAACAPDPPPPDSPVSAPAAPPLTPTAPPPVPPQAAPAVLLAQAEAFAARLDSLAALPGARVLTAEAPNPVATDGPPRRVTAFSEGAARRLVATEPDDAGQMTGASAYYLDGEALVFVRGPFARYAFAQDSLAVWADEHGRILNDVPPADRAARERALRADAARYRALFPAGAARP